MDSSPTHILVVDDEKSIREGCSMILRSAGYTVDSAEDGAAGFDKISAGAFDIAVVDLKMPGMSGIELIEAVRANKFEVVPIAITGYASISSAVEAMKMGAYDYLSKPFTPEELLLIIHRAEETVRLRKMRKSLLEERERSLKDLDQEKGRLKSVLEGLADGIIVMDRDGKVALTNPALRSILRADDPDSDRTVELTRKMGDKLREVAAGVDPSFSKYVEEISLGGEDGLTVQVSYAPVLNNPGDTIGSVAVIRDITKIKELDREKFNFVRMVTHELKAPVGAIQGYLDLILDGLLEGNPDKQREVLQRSRERAASLLKLIGDLLSVMKMRSGLSRRTFEPADLAKISSDAAQLLKVDADARGISIDLDVEPGFPLIEADKTNLEEIVTNLVSNAIKYNRDGGAVKLKLRKRGGGQVSLACSDTGIGIPKEAQARLFDEFFRVRNQKTSGIPGTGLGLSIVKEMVSAHGGRIDVESVPDEGTMFTVFLPVQHKTDEAT